MNDSLLFCTLITGLSLHLLPFPVYSASQLEAKPTKQPKHCGATMVRLNMDMEKLYGLWYPIEVSQEAYSLWITAIYGKSPSQKPSGIVCPTWEFTNSSSSSPQLFPSMTVRVKAGANAKIEIEAILLGDESHPGKSKWVMSWADAEDTLTSIVATGFINDESTVYDWLLTMDCDVNGDESPDWAIFSRKKVLEPSILKALEAVVEGIDGVDPADGKIIGSACQ